MEACGTTKSRQLECEYLAAQKLNLVLGAVRIVGDQTDREATEYTQEQGWRRLWGRKTYSNTFQRLEASSRALKDASPPLQYAFDQV